MLNAQIAQTLQRRSWAGAGGLVAILGGLLVAFLNIYAGMLLVGLGLLAIAAMLLQVRATPAGGARPRKAVAAFAPSTGVQRVVYTADGDPRAALVVPVESTPGYAMVLTSEGYKLVDDAGKIVYTLK